MAWIRSTPQRPVPWRPLLLAVAGLWVAPVALGLAGLMVFAMLGNGAAEAGLYLWFVSNALLFSPVFSWIGWFAALPAVALALRHGVFGWAGAALIGAVAGSVAGAVAETEIALPFGILALLALRAVLGRWMPL